MGPLEIKGAILLLAVAGGIFCIYLGFRLYVLGVLEKGSGSASGGGMEVTWKDYGPGVVFAVFGALLIVFAVTRDLTSYTERTYNPLTQMTSEREEAQGAMVKETEFATGASAEAVGAQNPSE